MGVCVWGGQADPDYMRLQRNVMGLCGPFLKPVEFLTVGSHHSRGAETKIARSPAWRRDHLLNISPSIQWRSFFFNASLPNFWGREVIIPRKSPLWANLLFEQLAHCSIYSWAKIVRNLKIGQTHKLRSTNWFTCCCCWRVQLLRRKTDKTVL